MVSGVLGRVERTMTALGGVRESPGTTVISTMSLRAGAAGHGSACGALLHTPACHRNVLCDST